MIKIFHGLSHNQGLSIWLYDSIEDAPSYCKNYQTMEREGILCYHAPSAELFWKWLRERPSCGINTKWETITTDRRKPINPVEI
jgi:hypothetical protein